MADARALLDAYAAEDSGGFHCYPEGGIPVDRDDAAPAAFAALSAVLDLAKHYDDIGDRMWTESAANDIRRVVTAALGG